MKWHVLLHRDFAIAAYEYICVHRATIPAVVLTPSLQNYKC